MVYTVCPELSVGRLGIMMVSPHQLSLTEGVSTLFAEVLFRGTRYKMCLHIQIYIYILGVFTEKPYSKPVERNVVYTFQ